MKEAKQGLSHPLLAAFLQANGENEKQKACGDIIASVLSQEFCEKFVGDHGEHLSLGSKVISNGPQPKQIEMYVYDKRLSSGSSGNGIYVCARIFVCTRSGCIYKKLSLNPTLETGFTPEEAQRILVESYAFYQRPVLVL